MEAERGDDGELTTEEAAVLLNVSRAYCIELIDTQALRSRQTPSGARLVAKAEVIAYKDQMRARQSNALDALMEESERLGLYDDELSGVLRRQRSGG